LIEELPEFITKTFIIGILQLVEVVSKTASSHLWNSKIADCGLIKKESHRF